ncbi:hypothetical protein [Fibrivirga algicola]|uniref:Uncharacterized protein n=1 Tax=Fibrivirga algicola TaxID=2950420 RepID=A0ABX0QH78_9BACT|nr:hypothetical protein [Fibrivirga algicola]ARK09540.1 hypothetical protein A6C57_03875 [Fibrella sp. ES10-3-2-2]NID10417.1 hypothetical protein [Fibrivirga algicola]
MLPILLIALLSLLAQLILPWWSIALVAFAFCFGRPMSGGRAFLASFLGVGLVWLGYALLQHVQSGGILTSRMSEVMKLPASPVYLLVLTPVLGGLVAGFSGLAGYWVRQTVLPTIAVKS